MSDAQIYGIIKRSKSFIDSLNVIKKNTKKAPKCILFIGLNVFGVDQLAIKEGEDPGDFHITLLYGFFTLENDIQDAKIDIRDALEAVKKDIPEKIEFDSVSRFKPSESSDGRAVIYARVKAGQLERVHESLLRELKARGIEIEKTFPVYKPHLTLAYIAAEKEYPLNRINAEGIIRDITIGIGVDSSKEEQKTIEKTEDSQEFSVMKTDEDKHLVFGWASIATTVDGEQLEDLQRDIIEPEDLEEAVYQYVLSFRDGGEEHNPTMRKKASLIESVVFTKEKMTAMGIPEGILPEGWWIGFYVKDEDAWQKIKDGTYKMFSIEGKAVREDVEKEDPVIRPVAKSFNQVIGVEKFNPYHDRRGRFARAEGFMTSGFTGNKERQAVTFSANPKTREGAMAIARHSNPENGHELLGAAYSSGVEQTYGRQIPGVHQELVKGLGREHAEKMAEMVSKSPEFIQKTWNDWGDQIGVGSTTQRSGSCDREGKINVDLATHSKDDAVRPAYNSIFHESAHSMDLAMGRAAGVQHFSTAYKDGLFEKTIIKEVQDYVKAKQIELQTVNGEKVPIARVYEAISKELKGYGKADYDRHARAYRDVSDIFEGATKAKIEGCAGHGKQYWTGKTAQVFYDQKVRIPGISVAVEAFAEMFSATTSNPDSLAKIKEYLPKSYAVFQEMLGG